MEQSSERKADIEHLTALESMVSVETISLNISQSVIVTTEDKVRITLEAYVKSTGKKTEWVAPFSLIIAIFATLATANFHDFILDAPTWKAMFIMSGIGSVAWLVKSLFALKNTISIDDLINELKTGNTNGNLDVDKEEVK